MADPLAFSLLEHQQLVADGEGAAVDIGALRQVARLHVDVVDLSDGAELTLFVETRPTESSAWSTAGSLELDALGTHGLTVGPLSRHVRVRWELSGEATVGASGEAHVVYCLPADVTRFSMPARALDSLSLSEQLDACIAATDKAAGYVGNAYRLPLKAWGDDLRSATACLAGAQLLSFRGVDPEGPDAVVFQREEGAVEWLNRLANGRLSPPGIVDQTPETFEGGSVVMSRRPPRGW